MKPPFPAPARAKAGRIDVAPIIAATDAKIPPNLKDIYDKSILSGMRVMFDKASHKMLLDELEEPGPLATRIANGIIKLVYLLWKQSNYTLPPQIVVPVTLVLTLKAFEFLQQSKDPEATKEVMGEAVADAVQGVMDRFGANQAALPGLLKAQQQGAQGGAQPQPSAPGGMLAAAKGVR